MTVVRRISGGGAMFIEPGEHHHLLAVRAGVAGGGHVVSPSPTRYLDTWVIDALTEDLGVAAWYQPLNDITSGQGKIGGAAQKRVAAAPCCTT